MKKHFFYISLFVSLLVSCQAQKKEDHIAKNEENNKDLIIKDLLTTKLSTLSPDQFKLENGFNKSSSEFSEYLTSFKTEKEVPYTLGAIPIDTTYSYQGKKLPNGNYVSFVKSNNADEIISIHLKINYLGNKNAILNELNKKLGQNNKLNDEQSINTMKRRENFYWKNYIEGQSIITSQYSESTIGGLTKEEGSQKIQTFLVYIYKNDAKIEYPNGQVETIEKRLTKRFSR
ncbi:hypothetical protein [Aquimarina sp. LLG6339-5]|uniref:hypothetical protein n=1 Tax=Aquimarina sp. LLG6339-5 TaxID=3160830 RepID=UPI0038688A83